MNEVRTSTKTCEGCTRHGQFLVDVHGWDESLGRYVMIQRTFLCSEHLEDPGPLLALRSTTPTHIGGAGDVLKVVGHCVICGAWVDLDKHGFMVPHGLIFNPTPCPGSGELPEMKKSVKA